MTDITQWLSDLDLDEYAENFAQHDIDASLLRELDHELLQQIGVASVGHRLRILKAVEQLEASASAAAPASPSADTKTHHPSLSSPAQAERRQLTVMFVDLVGSTVLSRELDPEDLREINRGFQDAVKQGLEQFGGYVARYMGDGVLAYFGYPQAHEDDAERAVHAGLALTEAIAALAPGGLSVRVGIATGPVVVGDLIGDGASQESAVVGETPNLAARLQALAEPGTVLVSEATHVLTGATFVSQTLAPQELKGFAEPVPVMRIIEARSGTTRFEARSAVGLSPLIGRDSELAMVRDRWQQARAGDGQMVLVMGEAGIGKSRLVHAFEESLRDDEPISMTFQCSPHHTRSPFLPVISGLDRAAGIAVADDAARRAEKLESWLEKVSPEDDYFASLARALVLPQTDATPIDPRELHLQFLVSLIDSPARPVVLLFEDMHWADPTTLEAAEALLENLADDRVLVLMTARPEFEPPWPAPANCTVLSLNRLGRAQRAALIAALGGPRRLADDVVQRIIEQTDGVPLFVEEVTNAVLAGGGNTTSGPESTVPATLHDSLLERLDRLGDAKRVAQRAAVIGRDFSRELLARALGPVDTELDAALERLVDSGLVLRRRATGQGEYYSFKHALLRDASYESMLRAHRREAHAAIAAALEADGADDANIEQLAWHHEGAGQLWEAARRWRQASHRARSRTALLEAAALAEAGLRITDQLAESGERDALELELQFVRGISKRFTEGNDAPAFGESMERVRALCERSGDRRLVRALFQLTMFHWGRRDLAAMQQTHEAIMRFADHDNLTESLFAQTAAVAVHIWSDTPIKARPHVQRLQALLADVDRALERMSSEVHPPGRQIADLRSAASVARVHIGRAGHMLGDFDTSLASANRELANARQGPAGGTIQILADVSILHLAAGNRDEALECAERLLELARRARQRWYMTLGRVCCLTACAAGGDKQAVAELVQSDVPALLGFTLSALLVQGQWRAIDTMVERYLPRAEQAGWAPDLRMLQTAKAVSSAFQAHAGSAIEGTAVLELRSIVELSIAGGALHRGLQAATYLAHILVRTQRNHEAHEVLGRVYDSFTEGFGTPRLRAAKTLLDELAG